jgi:GNAT superfamily N-acetyltransferase
MPGTNLSQGYSIYRKTGHCYEEWLKDFTIAAGLFCFLKVLIDLSYSNLVYLPILIFSLIIFVVFIIFLIDVSKTCKKEKWFVEFRKNIIGYATIVRKKDYVYLSQLEIHYKHQRRGLGTALVKSIISEIDRPIQLICSSNLELFYSRLGFETVVRDGTGLRMQCAGTRSTLGVDDLDKVQVPANYTVNLLKGEEKWVAQWFLIKQWWIGSTYVKRISLILLLIGFFCFFVVKSNFWIQVSFFFGLGISPFLIDYLPHYCLTINSQDENLISVYLSWRVDSAEIYVFFNTNVSREQDVKVALIQHVAKVVDVPVYLVCDRQYCDFYVQMGFQPVAKHRLPFILKVTSRASGVGMCYPTQP